LTAQDRACQAGRRASRAEGLDRVGAGEVFGDAVAQRQRARPEQRVEGCNVVADERGLVAVEHRFDFGQNLRLVELHHSPSRSAGRCSAPPSLAVTMKAAARPSAASGQLTPRVAFNASAARATAWRATGPALSSK